MFEHPSWTFWHLSWGLKYQFKVNWLFIKMKLYAQKICFIHQTWFTFLGHFIPYVSAEFSDAVRGLIFKVNPKLENVHCKLRENLPSSSLNATFGQRLFQPKHILQKDVHVFSQWSLHPSGYNNFFHRFIPHTQSITINQSITSFYATLSYICIVVRMLFLNATVPCIVIKTAVLKTTWLVN